MTKPGYKKYRVHKTNIMDDDGNKVRHGEEVELSPRLARHYGNLGFLLPVFDDDLQYEEEESDDPTPTDSVGNPKTEFARSRRPAAVKNPTEVLTSPVTQQV